MSFKHCLEKSSKYLRILAYTGILGLALGCVGPGVDVGPETEIKPTPETQEQPLSTDALGYRIPFRLMTAAQKAPHIRAFASWLKKNAESIDPEQTRRVREEFLESNSPRLLIVLGIDVPLSRLEPYSDFCKKESIRCSAVIATDDGESAISTLSSTSFPMIAVAEKTVGQIFSLYLPKRTIGARVFLFNARGICTGHSPLLRGEDEFMGMRVFLDALRPAPPDNPVRPSRPRATTFSDSSP